MLRSILKRLVHVHDAELSAMVWSAAYFFFLFSSYYILRPLRDEMGITGGVKNLQWLMTATLVAMLVANPVFSALVARFPRHRFIPSVYQFFLVNLLVFYGLMRALPPESMVHVARVFYVWTSVFNLFAVSVFWGFMADLYSHEQGRRLFGFIGAGGTLGAILGSALTAGLAELIGPVNLLLVAAALLEVAVLCVHRLARICGLLDGEPVAAIGPPEGRPDAAIGSSEGRPDSASGLETSAMTADFESGTMSPTRAESNQSSTPAGTPSASGDSEHSAPHIQGKDDRGLGGGLLEGIVHVLRSRYLAAIAAYLLLFTISSTFLYFEQVRIVAENISKSSERTELFATIDLAVNVLTLVIQTSLTGRFMARLGVGPALLLLPMLTTVGFVALGAAPVLGVVMAFLVSRRAADYAITKPAREILYTVVGPDDKYKSKSFIDTFVYRGGDALGAWVFSGLEALELGLSTVALAGVPVALLWMGTARLLARRQQALAQEKQGLAAGVQVRR